MIQKNEPISSKDFNKGLVTRSDIVKSDPDQSPNCMNIKWFFDGAIGKRFGSSTTNTVALANSIAQGFAVDSSNTLSTGLRAYWKMDEASGTRFDFVGSSNLRSVGIGSLNSGPGIILGAASMAVANSQVLQVNSAASLDLQNLSFSISTWIFKTSTSGVGGAYPIIYKNDANNAQIFELLDVGAPSNQVQFIVYSDGATMGQLNSTAFGALNTSSWYNVVCWYEANSTIGISVNATANTMSTAIGINPTTGGFLSIGGRGVITAGSPTFTAPIRIDETALWAKVLSAQERSDLYNGGSADTFTAGASGFGWAMFDFGATSIRWLTVAAGTGIFASSNGGTTFLTVHTSRTQTYQYMDRSKNVLIATSDGYDPPLYWAGSAGTSMQTLAPSSAPNVKFSINYQGFLILLNSQTRPRGFFYADENLQLTDPWTNGFDIPSSADDEITAAFVLFRWLYISTKYKIFRVIFIGGNPDWQYLKVRDWGFVPRTVKLATIKGIPTAMGLDYGRRMRVFNGSDDFFVSDNVENNNNICDFSMRKISLAGSGLQICNAEFDTLEQEYRLNVAIGAMSTQVTHAIVLNGRTTALYPYSNQLYQNICMAESNGIQRLMAVDRSGFVHILNSGNLDVSQPINEIYDSPLLFKGAPEIVAKSKQLDLFFSVDSCGVLYYQDRFDFSNAFSGIKALRDYNGNAEFTATYGGLQAVRTIDIQATQNIYQFRLTSSSNTANPWKMTHYDFLQAQKGFGRAQIG